METGLTRLTTIVVEINTIKRQVAQTTVAGAIAVGQRLQEAKAAVPHGEWGDWLRINVEFSVRTAENLMALSREYAGRDVSALEDLGLTKAVQLLALPGAEREAFMAENPVEDMSSRELKAAIEELKAEKEKMQLTIDELMAAPSAADEALATAKTELEEALRANASLAQEKQQALDAASSLRAQNGQMAEKAQQHAKDEAHWKDARHKLQAELTAAEKERDRYREELDKAGQPIIQQVTPPEVLKELEELRSAQQKQAATSGNEQAVAQFRVAFDNFKTALNQMIGAMGDMSVEIKARYETAMLQTLRLAESKVTGGAKGA